MAEVHTITNKFLVYINQESYERHRVIIPDLFLNEYGHGLIEIVRIIFRDGNGGTIGFNRRRKILIGMKNMFVDTIFRPGFSLLFEYLGISRFLVYSFDIGGCEVVNGGFYGGVSDNCIKLQGWCSVKGDVKFQILLDCTLPLLDVDLPEPFVQQFGSTMPSTVFFILNNGQCFEGRFCVSGKKLHAFCDVLHFISCGTQTRLIITYDADGMLYISAFNTDGTEISLLNTELNYPGLKNSIEVEFEIDIQKSYLQNDCIGVYVRSNFRHITDHWTNPSHLVFYQDNSSWEIEVKKKNNKVTLHNGWISFCKDLNIMVGDICCFRMRECYNHFDVFVLRKTDNES